MGVTLRVVLAGFCGSAAAIAVTNVVRKSYGREAWLQHVNDSWDTWPMWASFVSLAFVVWFMSMLIRKEWLGDG